LEAVLLVADIDESRELLVNVDHFLNADGHADSVAFLQTGQMMSLLNF
jgi:hypothetical protein